MKSFKIWFLLAAHFVVIEMAQAAPTAILVRASGSIEVIRGNQKLEGRNGFQLQTGDKVNVTAGSVTIYSLNGPPKTLQRGSVTIGSTTTKSGTTKSITNKSGSPSLWKGVYDGLNRGLNRNDRRVALTMRPGSIEPVSPLPLLIDSVRPRFEWFPGALNAPRYEVMVLDAAQNVIWRGQTEKNFLDYPTDATALSGALSWKVAPLRMGDGVWLPITDWTSRAFPFQIASSLQFQRVRSKLNELESQYKGISPIDLAIMRASLWSEQGFNQNALRELDKAGNDETASILRRQLWLQTGQNWRLKAETRLTQQPIGSANPKLLQFAPDSAINLTNLKGYTTPDGQFSLQIPANFAVFNVELAGKAKIYEFGATQTSQIRCSLTFGRAADFSSEGSLLKYLTQSILKNSDLKQPVPTTFRGHKALLSRWHSKSNGVEKFGALIEWREAGRVWLAAWSGDKANAELLRPVFSSLRLGTLAQPLKGAIAKNIATSDEFYQWSNSISEVTLAEMSKNVRRLQERSVDEPPSDKELISIAEYERLDKIRISTKPDTHERAEAALRASRLAARLVWSYNDKKDLIEAKRWFELHTQLDKESYVAVTAAFKRDIKATDETIAQFAEVTPPMSLVFPYSVTVSSLFKLKFANLQLWNTLALVQRDYDALEHTYRELASINRIQFELDQLSDNSEENLLDRKRLIANDFDNLAYAAQKRADLDGARAYFSRALDWRRSLPKSYLRRGLIDTLRFRAALESELGDNRLARDFYEQAIAEIDSIKSKYEAEIQAESDTRLRNVQWSDWLQTRAQVHNQLALAVWAIGDFSSVEAHLKKSLEVIEPLPMQGFAGSIRAAQRASALNNLAAYYSDTGDSAKAEEHLSQCLEIYRTWGDDFNQAFTLLNSAGNDYALGRSDEALSKAINARVIFVQLKLPHEVMKADIFISKLESKRGNVEKALTIANDALKLARTQGNDDWLASAVRSVAAIHLDSANTPWTPEIKTQVAALLAEASRIDERTGLVFSRIKTLALRARFEEKIGEDIRALGLVKNAITLSEQMRVTMGANSNYSEVKENYEPYEQAVRLLIKLNRSDEAFDMMGRARSKKLLDSLRLSAVQSNDSTLQKLLERSAALDQKLLKTRAQLASEVAQPATQRDSVKIDHLRDLIANTQAEFFEVSQQIKSRNPRFDKALSLSPRELKKAQRAIPVGTLLLQYAPLDDGLYIFAVTRDSLKIYSPKVTRSELATVIRAYRGAIDADISRLEKGIKPSSFDDTNSPLRDASEKLSQWLLTPVQTEIEAARTVAVIPSGELFYVPFHALGQSGKNGKWRFLIEEKPVAYLMSGDVLSIATERDETQQGQGILALGDPAGANLPAARTEVESIARIFPASRALIGADASKITLLQPSNLSKRVVHLAAHGVLDSARPDQSFIQLSPNGADDGKLRVGEIYGLNLNQVDLVTLSACRTAVGEGEPDGTEISSLAQSFSTAGTPSVVASLWNVEDGSTAHLMEKFYTALTEGDPKGIALQKAQIALLNDPKTRHPIFWAPFELLGDWR